MGTKDLVCKFLCCRKISDTPASHCKGFRESTDDNAVVLHSREGSNGVEGCSVVYQAAVDLIGEDQEVVLNSKFTELFQ